MNTAPFKIGDQVVAVKTVAGHGSQITKGEHYTVEALHMCKCGNWRVDIGLTQLYDDDYCTYCLTELTGIVTVSARFLALAEPRRVEISIGIAYPETEERLDVVKTSEPCTQS